MLPSTRFVPFIAASTTLATAASVFAASTVSMIPQFGGQIVTPLSINTAGAVAGNTTVSGSTHAVVYNPTGGTVTDLGMPVGSTATSYNSSVSVITPDGTIYGGYRDATTNLGYLGFKYASGVLTTITAPTTDRLAYVGSSDTTSNQFIGANASGLVVAGTRPGNFADEPVPKYTLAGGALTAAPSPAGATKASLNRVNSAGFAVGLTTSNPSAYFQSSGNTVASAIRLATYDTTTPGVAMVDRGTPTGYTIYGSVNFGSALSVNDSGTIALTGRTQTSTAFSPVIEAFKFTVTSGFVGLTSTLGVGSGTGAAGINAAGDIVGTDYNGTQKAVVWLNGATVATDLNTFLPTGSGWVLTSAAAISDTGTVTGLGTLNGVAQAFTLTGVPEPTTLAGLMTAGLIGLRRRRDR